MRMSPAARSQARKPPVETSEPAESEPEPTPAPPRLNPGNRIFGGMFGAMRRQIKKSRRKEPTSGL